ncbi:MAG: adenosylcobinamide-GDP ribazoletransferase [Caldilineaceae bacterium]|nr:adenosylcobinamide-GDP ribazoletransferase [Caldilineaceae bacterium]
MAAARLSRLWGEFWLAATFLTTLPAPKFVVPPGGLGPAGRWFPLVGLLIGLLLWGVQFLAGHFFPALLTGALVVLAWVALTGGLHLDGLADCCDGLLATTSRERRLEILRDPRTGSFGVLGLVLTLLLKVLAVWLVTAMSLPMALIIAPVWARWLLLLAARQPQARPEGLGALFAAGLTPGVIGMAAVLPLFLLTFAGGRGIVGVLLASLAMLALVRLARQRLGGVTGDVYGLVVEVCEVVLLLVFVAQPYWGWGAGAWPVLSEYTVLLN